jgi:hypothetical protein
MPILEYAIPCQLISIDQRTNAVSLFNIIETLEVVRRPGETSDEVRARSLVPIEVVTLWRRLEEDDENSPLTQVLTLTAPDGSEEDLSRIRFRIPHFRHRIHVQLPPLDVGQEGDHLLRVYLGSPGDADKGDLQFEYPIRVLVVSLKIVIELTPQELEFLGRPVAGQGGFQSLLRRIQGQIAHDRLVLTDADAERLIRYATQYGGGGFQERLGRIVEQARAQLAA